LLVTVGGWGFHQGIKKSNLSSNIKQISFAYQQKYIDIHRTACMSHVPSTDICIVHVLSQWMWHFHSPPSQDIVPRTTLGQVLQANKFPDPGRITKITDHADSSRT